MDDEEGLGDGVGAVGAANRGGVGLGGAGVLVLEGLVALAVTVAVGVGFRSGVGGIGADAVGDRWLASGVGVGVGECRTSAKWHTFSGLK